VRARQSARIAVSGVTLAAVAALVVSGRRSMWLAAGGMLAGAVLLTVTLQRVAVSRVTSVDQVSFQIGGWSTAAAIFSEHRWLGIGLAGPDARALSGASLQTGGALLWFLLASGLIGAVLYLVVWLRSLWSSGASGSDWRSATLHGMLLGAFATTQHFNMVAGAAAASGVLLTLAIVLGLAGSPYVSSFAGRPRAS
jgi:hypothetical protein